MDLSMNMASLGMHAEQELLGTVELAEYPLSFGAAFYSAATMSVDSSVFTPHVPSYVCGFVAGKCWAEEFAIKPNDPLCSYNGTILRQLPYVDPSIYPYLFIVKSWIGSIVAIAAQSKAYVAIGSSGSEVIYWENPSLRCNYANDAWGEWSENGSFLDIALHKDPSAWANFDVYKSGTLWLAATDPVIVSE